MKRSPPAAFFALSIAALAAAVVASIATLVWPGSFPAFDANAVNEAWAEARGWSAVTSFAAAPLLAASLLASGRSRSTIAFLGALGSLAYLVYTYLELAVSPPFTALYLVYVVAFACAACALVIALTVVDVDAIAARFAPVAPRNGVAVFASLVALGLSAAWGKDIATRTVGGDFGWPAGESAIGHVVHALDLGLQVPLAVAAAVLLFANKRAGFVVGAIAIVNAVLMGAALTAMVAVGLFAHGEPVVGAWPFALLPLAALGLASLSLVGEPAVPTVAAASALRFVTLLFTRRLRQPRNRNGVVVGGYRVFRETDARPIDGDCVLLIWFRLWFVEPKHAFRAAVFRRVCILTTPFFSGVDGFKIKLWMEDRKDARYLGIYEFSDAASATRYASYIARVIRVFAVRGSVSYEVRSGESLARFLAGPEAAPNRRAA